MHYSKTGTGPLLIYLPGMDGTGQFLFRQIPELSQSYSVVTFPFRQEPPFDYSDLTHDILAILDAEHAEKATIVAESFGGTVGLHFGLQHSDRIDRLILINTFPYFKRRFLLSLGSILLPLAFTPLIHIARKLFLKPILLGEKVDQNSMNTMFRFSFSQKPEAYRQRLSLIKNLDVRNQLSEISAPVTLVAADHDKLVPSLREATMMSKKIPNSRIVILPELGHACLISNQFSLLSILQDS